MNALPAISITEARLPAAYEAAKAALANCASLDECLDWADKAAALASYARQADDRAMLKTCIRIKARAIRRCGELLKTLDARGKSTAADTFSQRQAASDAGMSKRQQVTAVRLASVPVDDFDTAIDSDKPPTVTAFAELGTQHRSAPAGHGAATTAIGTLRRFAEFCAEHDAAFVAGGVCNYDNLSEIRGHVATIDAWLDRFIVNLEG